jgi:hypothetical protein
LYGDGGTDITKRSKKKKKKKKKRQRYMWNDVKRDGEVKLDLEGKAECMTM